MQIRDYIATKRAVSAPLLLVIYVFIFVSVFLTDLLPDIPGNQDGLDVDQAWADLHKISARPHSYNSHENNAVRTFILSRLHSVAAGHSHVHVLDDLHTNVSYIDDGNAAYFEGKNVIVKIDGSDSAYAEEGGVLFSAHFDSVSTAVGATDDGMGTVTLIQFVQYLANNRPKRTAIFNINDGEEDGLNGALSFLNHPWSKIPDSFINLEGSGAGGRPILFRATSLAPVLSALSKYVPHPHANVLSGDAFDHRLIRSRTDYSIYHEGGHYQGADLAFYKHRSHYHTKFDSIPYIRGQKKSLWSMMEATRGAGWALLNEDELHNRDLIVPAVFFDLFAAELVAFSKATLLTINITALAIFPLIILAFALYRQPSFQRTSESEGDHSFSQTLIEAFKELWGSVTSNTTWAAFWVALVVSVGTEALLVLAYVKINPFIIYSAQYYVLFTLFAYAVLAVQVSVRAYTWYISSDYNPSSNPSSKEPPTQQEAALLAQLYIFTWILTLVGTVLLTQLQLGGVYFLTAWNISVFLSLVLRDVAAILPNHPSEVSKGKSSAQRQTDGPADAGDERTPLLRGFLNPWSNGHSEETLEEDGDGEKVTLVWLLQVLLAIAPPVILVFHLVMLLLDGLTQSLADGGSPVLVYVAVAFFALILALPIAPWSSSVHPIGPIVLSVLSLASLIYTLAVFPFSQDAPLKVFFQQTLELTDGWHISNASHNTLTFASMDHAYSSQSHLYSRDDHPYKVTTALVGTPYYLRSHVVPTLPSSIGESVICADTADRSGTITCKWDSSSLAASPVQPTLPPPETKCIVANVTRTGPTSAQFSVKGMNTRNCRIYFDSRALVGYQVHGAQNAVSPLPGYEMPEEGVRQLRLFTRDWDRTFVVDVEWKRLEDDTSAGDDQLEGRIACEWNEYASARVGSSEEGAPGSVIPAFEEVLTFAPSWISVSKLYHGLVEASGKFSIS